MLYFALFFLVIAMVSGVLGFGLVDFSAARLAETVFAVSYSLCLASLVAHAVRRNKTNAAIEDQSQAVGNSG